MARPPTKFVAIDPEGNVHQGLGVSQFALDNGLEKTEISRCLNGRKGTKSHRGWRFFYPEKAPHLLAQSDKMDASKDLDEYRHLIDSDDEIDSATLIKLAMRANLKAAIGHEHGIEPPPGLNVGNINKSIELLAKAEGLDLDHIKDNRTPDQKFKDCSIEMLKNGATIFERLDDELDIMEEQFAKVAQCGDEYERHLGDIRAEQMMPANLLPEGQDPGEPPGPKTIAAAAKLWIDRIRRVRHLADRARHPYTEGMDRRTRIISEATHTLRYQIYVNRSDIKIDHGRGRISNIFTIGDPHVRMSMGLWFSRNKYGVTERGVIAPGEPYRVPGERRVVPYPGAPYTGTMFMVPPRHGKTDFLKGVMGLEIGLNSTVQMAYIHDSEEEAQKVLLSVKHMFNRSKAQGRRNYRLFPYRLAKEQNGADMLRVENEQATRAPNIVAYGLWSSKQGLNVDILIGDDLVPQKDDNEAAKRSRRLSTWAGTWISRLQGKDPHIILSGYPRHKEDLMWLKYLEGRKAARSGFRDGDPIWILRMPVGGPNSSPKFRPIWDYYGPTQLRQRYRQISNRSVWAANFMLEPITDDMKIVRSVRLVNIDDPRIKQLLRAGDNRLSVDPAAKGDGTADKAGMVCMTIGDLVTEETRDGMQQQDRETLAIVRVAREIDATQLELMDEMRKISSQINISQAYVEVVGAYGSAIIEALSRYHNVHSVVPVKPSGSKTARFRQVAQMFEHADPLIPAKIAFPARYPRDENGMIIEGSRLEPLEGVQKLISYVENFAVEEGYHSLDAATQLCAQILPLLGVGEGAFSREVKEDRRPGTDPRKIEALERRRKKQHAPSRRGLRMTTLPV